MSLSKSKIFRFKQFDVDQAGCAMKINTDGVLLGALASADHPKNILDIGTGTGVIALMLAQRFPDAQVGAVEIDAQAAETAGRNFKNSPFAVSLTSYPLSFEDFFDRYPEKKYDLIVSNPPFYINSLKSPEQGKQIAKHADRNFFDNLVRSVAAHLHENGIFSLILPVDTTELVVKLGEENGLYTGKKILIRSFTNSEPHRIMLSLGQVQIGQATDTLTIYKAVNVYSEEYIKLLRPYFIAF